MPDISMEQIRKFIGDMKAVGFLRIKLLGSFYEKRPILQIFVTSEDHLKELYLCV